MLLLQQAMLPQTGNEHSDTACTSKPSHDGQCVMHDSAVLSGAL